MKRLLTALALLAVTSTPAVASPIVDFTGGIASFSAQNLTWGFTFSLSSTQSVASLGIWDEGANGLTISHQVGLWDASQNLLAQVTLDNTATPVASTSTAGRWLFANVSSPLSIGPGTYFLGALYTDTQTDAIRFQNSSATPLNLTTAGVTYLGPRRNPGGSGPANLIFPSDDPTSVGLTVGVFGPNLQFQTTAVPEPMSLILLGSGLAAFATRRRRPRAR